jgi:ribose/xylose/arabinose/galactoside ABC-type transport system permease subunit
MVLGLAAQHGWQWGWAAVACIGSGILMGFVNGFFVGVVQIPFFVVTLGTLAIFQSFALLVTPGAQTISLFGFPKFNGLSTLTNGNIIGSLPSILIIVLGLFAVTAIVLRFSEFGYSVYGVGANPEAARLAGIRTTVVLVSVYTLSGLLAGVGAIVHTGQLSAATPEADPNLMLQVVAAVLIGGTAFTGGDGNLLGTLVGVMFFGVIDNGLLLSGVSQFWQGMVSGAILIVAVGIGVLRDYGWRLGSARVRLGARRRAAA